MRRRGKRTVLRAAAGYWVLTAMLSLLFGGQARAGEAGRGVGTFSDAYESAGLGDIMDRLKLDEVEAYLAGQQDGGETDLPGLTEAMKQLMRGDLTMLGQELIRALKTSLLSEVSLGSRLVGQILLLGILSAVFRNFSGIFQTSQVSETGFFVTYLLLFTFQMAAM